MSRADNKQDRIETEAAGWLAAIECGTADAAAFEQWRSGDPARALAFIRVSQVNRSLDALRETGLAERALPLGEASPTEPVPDRRTWLKFGVAGAFAAGLGGLGWTYAAAAHEAETGVGERRRIVVARGVALELNTDSHVEWQRRDDIYRFELLRGEMMLERQRGSAPCSLHCGPSQIALAAGGRLNARSVPNGVDFSVLEGEASLRTSGSPTVVRVPTLQKARVAAGVAPMLSALSELDAGAVAAWQKGQLQFNGERLADAVAEYNRYLSRPIEIADPSIRDIQMGGRFSTTDPTDFCRALGQIYGVRAHFERDRIRLMRSGPEKI